MKVYYVLGLFSDWFGLHKLDVILDSQRGKG